MSQHRRRTPLPAAAGDSPGDAPAPASVAAAAAAAALPDAARQPAGKQKGLRQLGQSFNSAGIALFLQLLCGDRSLAIPHLSVPDIRWVDWHALRRAGFRGVVFDKDNTLTVPYALAVHPPLQPSLDACLAAFDGRAVLYSNSAGLQQFDPEGVEAAALEAALQLPVLRHSEKKPAGGPADLERHFGCAADELIMVGDRYLTDVVFGNRLGLLTVRPAPLTSAGEPAAVRAARRLEEALVGRWARRGVAAPAHALAPSASLSDFVREPAL